MKFPHFSIFFILGAFTSCAMAEQLSIDIAKVTTIAVNGGQDTANPGTTCIKVSAEISAACPGAYIAIPNNNKELISAALTAKASGSDVGVYYANDSTTNHCPGLVFTPCSLISLTLK